MLKFAADLSDEFEYFLLWNGQSNGRPWGTKAEGFAMFPDFQNGSDGQTFSRITLGATGARVADYIESVPIAGLVPAGTAANTWVNCHIRLGSTTTPLVGYAKILSHTVATAGIATFTIQWIAPASTAADTPVGYIVRENAKWASYPQVRVLVPYQPIGADATARDVAYPAPTATIANGGRALAIPGYTIQPGVTHETMGVFLPFTFNEGIDSYGISDASGGGAATNASATDFDFTTATVLYYFTNGYLRVDWHDGSVARVSWARILSNGTNKFTFTAWSGDGTPTGTANLWRWTAWVPHFNNSPHAYLPGEGFAYPTNDMQPCAADTNGSVIHNRPRGVTAYAYGDRFGEILVYATRLSMAIGKRVNIVHLSVNGALLAPAITANAGGFKGRLGWWNWEDHLTFAPMLQNSVTKRIQVLLGMVNNALLAEGNTKPAKCLGFTFLQGEADALAKSGKQHYMRSAKMYVTWMRQLLNDLGFNPYSNGAKIPFMQPRIGRFGFEYVGIYMYLGIPLSFDGDIDGYVNNGIVENVAADEFAGTSVVDDLPRVLIDPAHYNGVGECANAARLSDRMGALIDYALSFGSPCLDTQPERIIAICNQALSHIGETSMITSLDDGSQQAALCKQFLRTAISDLLQARQWGFALRRVALTEVKMPEQSLFNHFGHCYVVPPDALNAFAVLPLGVEVADFDIYSVLNSSYSGLFLGRLSPTTIRNTDDLPVVSADSMKPVPYATEQSPFGHRYIFTNEKNATLRYVRRVVDADNFSPQFSTALSLYLGSMLAGPIIKGDQGEAVSARLLQKASGFVKAASQSDAQQQSPAKLFDFIPDHMSDR